MSKAPLVAVVTGLCLLLAAVGIGWWSSATSRAGEAEPPSQLCVVWSSGDPGVAKNVCFMYTHSAKRAGWFNIVHLVVWGPSAKLLAESEELQGQIKNMQETGVVVEACVVCAKNYGVVDALQKLDIDVKPMGQPLTERLKGPWKVLTF
jgi:hypothetical protein